MSYFHYKDQTLWVENLTCQSIIEAIGTPAYIYSHQALVTAWQEFDQALHSHPHKICYAVKANSNLAVLQALVQLGSGFDIVSGGELARVIAAGGDPKQIVFSGVGKTTQEMAAALQQGIFCFNIESA